MLSGHPNPLHTIGHSTLTLDAFLALLAGHRIESLVDVRAFPVSRRFPHFSQTQLKPALENAGIQYIHIVSLGGRRSRQALPEGVEHDTRWRNPSFANYADYTKTEPFRTALGQLEGIADRGRAAIMCAEALWWQCHRQIIAEEAERDGFQIVHILNGKHRGEADAAPRLPGL